MLAVMNGQNTSLEKIVKSRKRRNRIDLGFKQSVGDVAIYMPGQSRSEAASVSDVKFEVPFRQPS